MSVWPRFFVYTDPRPQNLSLLETWHPPAHQEQLIRQLLESGFHPLVDSVKQPELAHVQEMHGVVLLENQEFILCKEYTGGKILCIQWYHVPVSEEDLKTIKGYCAPFYGVGIARSYITKDEQRLIDLGYMAPIQSRPILHQSEFIGNHIRVSGDDVTVL